tara:strand:+ start:175 stop:360 length:186 start_codon:yes stop_codon:yes gene_type:complete
MKKLVSGMIGALLLVAATGCAPHVVDEDAAATLSADRQNRDFEQQPGPLYIPPPGTCTPRC